MSYAVGQIIRVGEYNGFAGASGTGSYVAEPSSATIAGGASLGLLYGPGYGSYGYNQSDISLSPVSSGDPIRTGEWTNLRNILAKVRTHQNGSVDSLVPPTSVFATNHVVEAHESSAPTSNPYDFDSMINLALANRFALSGGTLISLQTMTRSGSWGAGAGTIQGVLRTVWANADAAGFFFNTGGYVRFNFTQPVSTSQDSDWADAFTTRIASVKFGAKSVTNTGTVSISTVLGYYALTGSYQTVWLGTGANGFVNASYSPNTVRIEALVSGASAHGRPGTTIDFRITLNESHTGPIDQVSSGTAVSMSVVKDTTVLTTVPATPTGSIQTNW